MGWEGGILFYNQQKKLNFSAVNFEYNASFNMHIFLHVGYDLRELISLISPIYWTSAYESGNAANGFTITNGNFQRETQVTFPSGMNRNNPKKKCIPHYFLS